jgi:hypothetical protein
MVRIVPRAFAPPVVQALRDAQQTLEKTRRIFVARASSFQKGLLNMEEAR